MLYRSNTWPVKEEDVVRLDRNDVWLDGCARLGLRTGFRVFPTGGDWGGGGANSQKFAHSLPLPPTYKNYPPSKLPSPPNFYFPLFPPSKANSPAPLSNNFQVTTQ